MLYDIRDHEWFALQSNPGIALEKYGLQIPLLPSAEIQRSFTALDGHHNLMQAFEFYRHVCSVCELSELNTPYILDFGGGWGRVSRFFLRNTLPDHIYIADTMQHAINCLKESGCHYSVIHNQPQPPIDGLPGPMDLVVSYSVFSHLSEPYFLNWVNYLLSVLRPGGHLAFTTRGKLFINHLKHLHNIEGVHSAELIEHIRRLREEMPMPDEIERRHANGELQFYPIGGSGELTSDFFGETFIPKSYIDKQFPGLLVDFSEDLRDVDQSVAILRKPLQ